MTVYQKLTIDYLEGRISPSDFEEMIDSDDNLYFWIQSVVPNGKTYGYHDASIGEYVRHIRKVMKLHEELAWGGPKGSLSYHYYIHKHIAQLMQEAFPQLAIAIDNRPEMLDKLSMSACPSYIGGTEVAKSDILGQLLSDISTEWSIKRQIAVARERIKTAFHIEGNKYPRWIQEPEWPMNNGKPMKFVKTVRINPEYVQHQFLDTDSGLVRTVDDFF